MVEIGQLAVENRRVVVPLFRKLVSFLLPHGYGWVCFTATGPVRSLLARATRTAMNGSAACRMNEELGVAMDLPELVARQAIAMLAGSRRERFLGWPERLFVKLNGIAPRLVDGALSKQRPVVEEYLRPRTSSQ